jgi:hypothetical protein
MCCNLNSQPKHQLMAIIEMDRKYGYIFCIIEYILWFHGANVLVYYLIGYEVYSLLHKIFRNEYIRGYLFTIAVIGIPALMLSICIEQIVTRSLIFVSCVSSVFAYFSLAYFTHALNRRICIQDDMYFQRNLCMWYSYSLIIWLGIDAYINYSELSACVLCMASMIIMLQITIFGIKYRDAHTIMLYDICRYAIYSLHAIMCVVKLYEMTMYDIAIPISIHNTVYPMISHIFYVKINGFKT